MWNRKERHGRSCETVKPHQEYARYALVGFISCGLRRNSLGAIVESTQGFTKVVDLHCLNCERASSSGRCRLGREVHHERV
jgi:hypothetical protein